MYGKHSINQCDREVDNRRDRRDFQRDFDQLTNDSPKEENQFPLEEIVE